MGQFFEATVLPSALWLLLVLWAFAPMFFANMAPPGVRAAFININHVFTGHKADVYNEPVYPPVFGKNKTWRGLLVAVFAGALVAVLQFRLKDYIPFMHPFTFAEYSLPVAAAIGAIQGLGAMVGDMAESAIKRSPFVNIPPGEEWPIFDQIDCGIGAFVLLLLASVTGLVTFPSFWESLGTLAWLLVFSAYLIPMANKLFHWIGLKEKPY